MMDLEQLALNSYLEGLQDVGWHGDPRLVRLGYCIAAALRFGPGCAVPALLAVTRPDAEDFVPSVFGISMDEALDRWSEITAHVLHLADEARELMTVFPMSVSNSDRR